MSRLAGSVDVDFGWGVSEKMFELQESGNNNETGIHMACLKEDTLRRSPHVLSIEYSSLQAVL